MKYTDAGSSTVRAPSHLGNGIAMRFRAQFIASVFYHDLYASLNWYVLLPFFFSLLRDIREIIIPIISDMICKRLLALLGNKQRYDLNFAVQLIVLPRKCL